MKRYRQRSLEVDACQWNLPSDHSGVTYYDPPGPPALECPQCGNHEYTHGWIEKGQHRVCPGDWVIDDGKALYPLKAEAFKATYERVWQHGK